MIISCFMDSSLEKLAQQVVNALTKQGLQLITAESCTAGWVAKAITDVAGASRCFERGFITYSNAAKEEMLAVRPATLSRHGAVSEAVVREMAAGALAASHADISVAVSGVAGPDGGTADKPVGLVWLAWQLNTDCRVLQANFSGGRDAIRRAAVTAALQGVLTLIE
ncbi:MAG TPA: CinA family protein [Gammaproteobacteria bacterium]|nr:CinA family protein [Gammaproteobacteria bacterium]